MRGFIPEPAPSSLSAASHFYEQKVRSLASQLRGGKSRRMLINSLLGAYSKQTITPGQLLGKLGECAHVCVVDDERSFPMQMDLRSQPSSAQKRIIGLTTSGARRRIRRGLGIHRRTRCGLATAQFQMPPNGREESRCSFA
jgi:hypothetical protein